MPAARANLGGHDVRCLRAHAAAAAPGARPGTPMGAQGDAFVIATALGGIAIEEVIAPNRGRESGASFWRRISAEARAT